MTKNENVMTKNACELVKALTAADKNCHAEGKEEDVMHSRGSEEASEPLELTENWDAVASTPIASSAIAFARDRSVPATAKFRVQCTWLRMSWTWKALQRPRIRLQRQKSDMHRQKFRLHR
jgi:hypothetical protein